MTQLRVLSLTTLLLMLASRLPGQPGVDDYDSQVGACNEGTISFSVARAYREANSFSADTWEFQGWYNVDPGKCQEIGPSEHYRNGGMFGKDSVTLLAFAFRDSTGTWGSIKIQGGDDRLWHPSSQQFCVQPEGFGYRRDSSGGDLPRACDGAQTGYQMIPASFEYTGPLGSWRVGFPSNHELRIKLGPSDRAIPLGKQSSGGGAGQNSGSTGSSQNNGDASPSMCGKVSCWDLFLQGLKQAAKDNEDQRAAANANHNPPQPTANNLPAPPPPAAAPRPVVSPAPAPSVDDPIGAGGFITPPSGYRKTLTADLIFGGAVHLKGGQWRFENGTALPANLLDPKSGRPPLLPKQQYSPQQAPVSQYIKTIKDVFASVQACSEYTDTAKTQIAMSVESSGFDLDDYGVLVSRTVATTPSSAQRIGYGQGAALANLDLQHAEFVDQGCMLLVIRCKNGSSCIRSQSVRRGSDTGDIAVPSLWFEINTREQAAKILDALTAVAPFYPAGDGETHEIP